MGGAGTGRSRGAGEEAHGGGCGRGGAARESGRERGRSLRAEVPDGRGPGARTSGRGGVGGLGSHSGKSAPSLGEERARSG